MRAGSRADLGAVLGHPAERRPDVVRGLGKPVLRRLAVVDADDDAAGPLAERAADTVVGVDAEHHVAAAVEVDVDRQRLGGVRALGPVEADADRPVGAWNVAVLDAPDGDTGGLHAHDQIVEALPHLGERAFLDRRHLNRVELVAERLNLRMQSHDDPSRVLVWPWLILTRTSHHGHGLRRGIARSIRLVYDPVVSAGGARRPCSGQRAVQRVNSMRAAMRSVTCK